eukprot:TRINITY_DN59415_c0_g1_i1.p1 TRINITY_DN59415_c0_g1~~TRINITY_DN59415_c0_g1_i1.p1  ORF type:complete len:752 (+),score=167.65 TRINITY_DN59415_c0_g1_i1:82-2256(+)
MAFEGKWTEHTDPETGKTYYHNSLTNETTWTKPAAAAASSSHNGGYAKAKLPAAPPAAFAGDLPSDWSEHKDSGTGEAFYYNARTKESSWTRPTGAATEQRPVAPSRPEPAFAANDDWKEHTDPETGRKYYHNLRTRETAWEKPDNKDQAGDEWKEHVDHATGKKYYHNTQTGETTWDRPKAIATESEGMENWRDYRDSATGKTYYYNSVTKETTWNKPKGVVAAVSTTSAPESLNGAWRDCKDPASGRTYYYNTSTKETTWQKPAEAQRASGSSQQLPSFAALEHVWAEQRDPSMGKTYYFNTLTKETTWDKPQAAASSASPATPATPATSLDLGWSELQDQTTGRTFYYNEVTRESAWERPGAAVAAAANAWMEQKESRPPPAAPAAVTATAARRTVSVAAAPTSPSADAFRSQRPQSAAVPPAAPIASNRLSVAARPAVPAVSRASRPSSVAAPPAAPAASRRVASREAVARVGGGYQQAAVPAPPPPKLGGDGNALRLLAFDFDCTIASIHLYEELAKRGGHDGVSQQAKLDAQCLQHPGYPAWIFGGADRQAKLQGFFQRLRSLPGRSLVVISMGWTTVVDSALSKGHLRSYFSEIIGREHVLMAQNAGKKDRVLMELMRRHGANTLQTILVDDDPQNLIPAADARSFCTAWVSNRRGGMHSALMASITEAAVDESGQTARYMFREDLSMRAHDSAGSSGVAELASLRQAVDAARLERR